MDNDEITYILCSIDSLTNENRDLRARLEAVEQNAQARSKTSTIAESNSVDNEQITTDDLALLCDADDDTVTPLTNKRLDDVKREVCAIKTTWADLRQLYPPRQSEFTPLTDADDDVEVDYAFSQAATMAAYGVELLRIALGDSKVNRRLTRQAYKLLATLCSTLIGTRDQHRSANKTVGEALNSFGHTRDMDAGIPKLAKPKKQGNLADASCVNKRKTPDCWDSSESDTDSSSSWRENLRHSGRRKRSDKNGSKPHTQGTASVASVPVHSCPDHNVSIGDASAANATVEEKPDPADDHGLVKRRVVIRNALLRQGLSESDISAYFDQWTKGTNCTYDSQWRVWSKWCLQRNVDPLKRSDADLDTCISAATTSHKSKGRTMSAIRSVWSTIEGPVQPDPKKEI